jgi:hypothetical protein
VADGWIIGNVADRRFGAGVVDVATLLVTVTSANRKSRRDFPPRPRIEAQKSGRVIAQKRASDSSTGGDESDAIEDEGNCSELFSRNVLQGETEMEMRGGGEDGKSTGRNNK